MDNQENNIDREQLLYIKSKVDEIDDINDKNYKNIVDLFYVINEVNKKSRAQIRQEIKTLQGLVIGCFAVGFLFFTSISDGKDGTNVDKLANSVTESLINNMDKVLALAISVIGGYKVFTAGKQAEEEEEEVTCNVLHESNVANQDRVLKSKSKNCEDEQC